MSQSATGGVMGGKGRGGEGPSTAGRPSNQVISLREENSGRTCVDESSFLRVKHLQRLAAWAGAEAGVDPVGALLGRRLAASAEAAGIPLGADTFLCQRCETILKPGFNCTVRIRKRNKTKRRKKSNCCQNSVSYACHFCGDQNLILGSGKGVVKSLLASRGQASVGLTHRSLRGNKSDTITQYVKDLSEHPQTEILQVNPSSSLTQLTSEMVEQGERLTLNPPTACEMEEGTTLSSVEFGHHPQASSSYEERIMQKIVLENINSSGDSSKKIETCESNVTLGGEFKVGSNFVTPQKNKVADSVEPFNSKSTRNKGEASESVFGKTLSSSSKSVPNDSCKHCKSATSDGAQLSGSSRKRSRKKWATLKEIAKKDEIERKEKMGNFVIPFFLQ